MTTTPSRGDDAALVLVPSMGNQDFHIEDLHPDEIALRPTSKPLSDMTVAMLMDSIAQCGLLNPVTVRRADDGQVHLIAGRHRLEAVRRLGQQTICCVFLPASNITSDIDAEIATIAENLHRRELGGQERARLIRAYAKAKERREAELQSDQPAPIESKRSDGRGHRRQGLASQIARDFGISKSTVTRALAPPRIGPPTMLLPDDLEMEEPPLLQLRKAWGIASPEVRRKFLSEVLT